MILSLLYEVDVPTCYRDPLWTKGNAGFVARLLKTLEIREDRVGVIIKTGPVLVTNPADFIDDVIFYRPSLRSTVRRSKGRHLVSEFVTKPPTARRFQRSQCGGNFRQPRTRLHKTFDTAGLSKGPIAIRSRVICQHLRGYDNSRDTVFVAALVAQRNVEESRVNSSAQR
jgi:hypothetical protein